MGVTVAVAGGMGGGAAQIFEERGVAVVAGASGDACAAAQKDLKGELVSTGEIYRAHKTRDHGNCH
jgi:predicted Fe-Mo cluster-binding NifX family protein